MPTVRLRPLRSCDLADKSRALLKFAVVGSQSAAAVLDNAGINPSTLLNSTGAGSIGDSDDSVEGDGEEGSSFLSYFNVFSDAQSSGPYAGWANDSHGTAPHR